MVGCYEKTNPRKILGKNSQLENLLKKEFRESP